MKKTALWVTVALCLGATLSCHHHHDEEEHHHHGEPMTAYNQDFELFAEVPTLTVGEDCDILAHFTKLTDFKPLDSTSVTMVLTVGKSVQRIKLDNPQQAGIYPFEITPEQAGCGSLLFEIATGDSINRIGFDHVHVVKHGQEEAEEHKHGEHEHEHGEVHEHEHEHAHAANGITFTKEQSWKIDFATEVCQPMRFGSIIRTSAQVLPSQGDERQVSAKASGIVVFSNLVEGASVSAGQRLLSIESNGMADNNMGVRFQEASANYQSAKADYERKQGLAADKIVSQAELERSRAAYESAKAAYDNLKGNFSQSGATATAPISGYVKSINVLNGAFVEAGQPLVTISQNRDLFIRAEVQPRYYTQLQHITDATFTLPNDGKTYSIESLGGSLVSYGKATDANNPLLPVTFRFRNTVDLMSGNFVTLYIRCESDSEVLTIPNTGLVEEMGNYFVFVQINPELFEKRLVTIGATDGIRTVITSGVKAGERVVSKGATMVKLAQGAGALDPHAGHVH